MLAVFPLSDPAPVDAWIGTWEGGIRLDSEWHAARVDLERTGDRIAGRIDVPALGAVDRPIVVEAGLDRITLAFDLAERGPTAIAASLEGRALRTTEAGGFGPAAVSLVRSSLVGARELDSCLGWYEIGPDSDALVTRGSEGGLRWFSRGACATLVAIAPDRFAIVYRDTRPEPSSGDVRFVRDAAGDVDALEWTEGTVRTTARRLRDHAFEIAPVLFRNGAIELSGHLLRPRGDERPPAVVFLAGTGYSTADRLYEMTLAERLLAKGIAVLLFDKRGCGASGGAWRTSSLTDLAGDAVAAISHVRASGRVRPQAIGLWGVSEGGWVAPLAASMSKDVAFLVDHGGPAVSPLEDELDDLRLGIRSVGFAGEDLAIATTLAQALVDFYASSEALPRFQAALDAARRRPWWPRFEARVPQREDDWRVQWWRKRGELDPARAWKGLSVPALVLIGGKDSTMDLAKNLALFEAWRADHPRLEIRVVPEADHGLRAGGTLVPGVVDGVADWIHGVLPR